jgi:aspartate/glutamate racemase
MKKIGIVGFTPATTIVYYREIVKKYQETFDPQMFPEMTLDIFKLTQGSSFSDRWSF